MRRNASGSGAAILPQGVQPPHQRLWRPTVPADASDSASRQRQCTSRRLLEELRGATMESRLEEIGVLKSFSRPRVSNDNPYSKSLLRTVKYQPDYPSRPFASKGEACEWACTFVDWYNHRHHHSAIKFVTAPPAPQWSCQDHLPAARRGLRDRPQGQSNALERCHPLLEPTGRSVDKQANIKSPIRC